MEIRDNKEVAIALKWHKLCRFEISVLFVCCLVVASLLCRLDLKDEEFLLSLSVYVKFYLHNR